MRALRRPIAIVLLAWYLPACTGFHPADVAPQRALNGASKAILTVHVADTTNTVYLKDPWATADSVGGTLCAVHTSSGWRCDPSQRWSAPASSVAAIQTRKTNPGGVVALVVVVAGIGVAAAVAASNSLNAGWR